MPKKDGTGPQGWGPMVRRGRGRCNPKVRSMPQQSQGSQGKGRGAGRGSGQGSGKDRGKRS